MILFDLEALSYHKDDFREIVEIAAYKIKILPDAKCSLKTEYQKRKYQKQFVIIDYFHSFIHPVFHSHIPKKLEKLIKLDEKKLKNGAMYEEAIEDFINWAGHDAVFVAWSNNDEEMIEENNQMFAVPHALTVVNLQKIYDNYYRKNKRTSLIRAVDEIGGVFEGNLHNPTADSLNMLPILNNLFQNNFLE